MASVFDLPEFNRALFFPRADTTPAPRGARDQVVDVPGAQLHVRWHAAPSARATLLLFHGNGEVVADYDEAAPRFAAAGLALVVADYRGYGQSTGEPTLRTMIADARAITVAVAEASALPVVVMGRSLGGAAAHELYAAPPARVIAVILESALFSLRALIERRGLVPPTTFSADERAMFDPATKLARGTLPLLVLHGERDTLIVPDEARRALAAAGGADKQLVEIPGRGHNDVSFAEAYWQAIAAFVARVSR